MSATTAIHCLLAAAVLVDSFFSSFPSLVSSLSPPPPCRRRVNVALTRAKKKLVVLGSGRVCELVPVLAALLALVRRNGWLVEA